MNRNAQSTYRLAAEAFRRDAWTLDERGQVEHAAEMQRMAEWCDEHCGASGRGDQVMNRTMFDATVNLEDPYALENELQAALDSLQVYPGDIFGVHIPADGENCEHGELVVREDQFSRPIQEGDWVVIGTSVSEIAVELNRLLAQN